MSLSPSKETVSGIAPVFAKVLELFTGGFSITTTGFNTGVTLPAGSLLKVDEAARTATLVKTAKATQVGSTTVHYVETGHHFAIGDYIAYEEDGKARAITAIATTTASGDKITVATGGSGGTSGIGTGYATASVFFAAATAAATSGAAVKTVANALSAYDTTIESGGFVTALLRGTAYKNRIQAHVAGHLADINLIHLSESY